MDIFLLCVALFCAVLAIIGSIVPIIPGVVLAYGSLWVARWSNMCEFSNQFMWIMAAITAVVFVIDYFLPPLIIRRMGGSKAASWGATIGMIAGIIFTPIGMMLGMILGAFVGEYMYGSKDEHKSLKATLGAILGFFVGTGIKLILCSYILYQIIAQAIL